MDRRELLGALGAGAVGLGTLATGGALAAPADHEGHEGHDDKAHADCLKACGDCAIVCDKTFAHCYTEVAAGKKEHAKSLRLVSDCAGFCSLSACMIAKKSPLMVYSCMSCAEACKDTAAEVGKFDSPEMQMAVKTLKACEASCRAMVASMKMHHPA